MAVSEKPEKFETSSTELPGSGGSAWRTGPAGRAVTPGPKRNASDAAGPGGSDCVSDHCGTVTAGVLTVGVTPASQRRAARAGQAVSAAVGQPVSAGCAASVSGGQPRLSVWACLGDRPDASVSGRPGSGQTVSPGDQPSRSRCKFDHHKLKRIYTYK